MFYLVPALVAAITWLSPISEKTAQMYAHIIVEESDKHEIDPFLVVAIIHVESTWRPHIRSKTNDYGLMQVHVAEKGSSRFLGKEKQLLDPRTNIREGLRLLAMWRNYHVNTCTKPHPFWSHYKWGRRVKTQHYGFTVKKLYRELLVKFKPEQGVT